MSTAAFAIVRRALGALGATQQEVEAAINALASKYHIGPVTYYPPAPYVVAAFGDDAWNGTCKLSNGSIINANEFRSEENFRIIVANQFDPSLWWSINPLMAKALNAPQPTTNYPYTPPPPPPTTTQPTNPTPPPATPTTYASAVVLTNTTRPTSPRAFQVGDRFEVDVTGQPGAQVSVAATHNGSTSSSPYGTIGSNGHRVIQGTMAAEHIGTWSEVWKVGDTAATPVLAFTVAAAPATPPTQTPPTQTPPTSTPPAQEDTEILPASGGDVFTRIGQQLTSLPATIAGKAGVPEWVIWAAAAATAYHFMTRRESL